MLMVEMYFFYSPCKEGGGGGGGGGWTPDAKPRCIPRINAIIFTVMPQIADIKRHTIPSLCKINARYCSNRLTKIATNYAL
jgi:hypothetical protein